MFAGKAAAAVRFAALRGIHTALSKRRVNPQQLQPLLTPQAQLVPLTVQSMDEDWYTETRRLGCLTMRALLELAGGSIGDEMLRQIYPELVKRLDDSSNDVRIANAASATAFVLHCLQPSYCDTNTGCAPDTRTDAFCRPTGRST
jgi:dynein assembly factor 5, axonemal